MWRAICVILVLATACNAQAHDVDSLSDDDLLARGEEHFRDGRTQRENQKAVTCFRSAANAYEELRQRGSDNALLYRNLGNAYLLADQLPEAILSYRRGLQRLGYDAELQENLEYARDLVQYPAGGRGRSVGNWPPWLLRPTPSQLLLLVATAWSLTCVGVTRWFMTHRGRWLSLAGGSGLVAIALASWLGYERWQSAQEAQQPLVVIAADSIPLRAGNGPSYPANEQMPTVYRGMEARQLAERGGWLQIEFPSGDVGWVPQEFVVRES